MKKIEKLEGSYDVPQLKQKLNEIIDYLNSQDQEGESNFIHTVGTPILEGTTTRSREDMERTDYIGYPYSKEFQSTTQDTPEQKEKWEERFAEFFLYVTNDKNWVDGRPEWKGDVFVTLYNAILHFIEKLLDERERGAIDTFLKDTASYNSFHNGRPRTMRNGLSGEGFEVRVSKLNK